MLITLSYSIIHQSWHYYKNDTMPDKSKKTRIYSNISGLYFNFKHISCFTKIHSKVPGGYSPPNIQTWNSYVFCIRPHTISASYHSKEKLFSSPEPTLLLPDTRPDFLNTGPKGSLREIPFLSRIPRTSQHLSPLLR